jgi:hypothetical protein
MCTDGQTDTCPFRIRGRDEAALTALVCCYGLHCICDMRCQQASAAMCTDARISETAGESVNWGRYVNKKFQDTGSIIQKEFILFTRQLLSSSEEKARKMVGSTGRP